MSAASRAISVMRKNQVVFGDRLIAEDETEEVEAHLVMVGLAADHARARLQHAPLDLRRNLVQTSALLGGVQLAQRWWHVPEADVQELRL